MKYAGDMYKNMCFKLRRIENQIAPSRCLPYKSDNQIFHYYYYNYVYFKLCVLISKLNINKAAYINRSRQTPITLKN